MRAANPSLIGRPALPRSHCRPRLAVPVSLASLPHHFYHVCILSVRSFPWRSDPRTVMPNWNRAHVIWTHPVVRVGAGLMRSRRPGCPILYKSARNLFLLVDLFLTFLQRHKRHEVLLLQFDSKPSASNQNMQTWEQLAITENTTSIQTATSCSFLTNGTHERATLSSHRPGADLDNCWTEWNDNQQNGCYCLLGTWACSLEENIISP